MKTCEHEGFGLHLGLHLVLLLESCFMHVQGKGLYNQNAGCKCHDAYACICKSLFLHASPSSFSDVFSRIGNVLVGVLFWFSMWGVRFVWSGMLSWSFWFGMLSWSLAYSCYYFSFLPRLCPSFVW